MGDNNCDSCWLDNGFNAYDNQYYKRKEIMMGDHRADIKLRFNIHGKTYKTEMYINYWPEGEGGIDQRIVDWFDKCWTDAYSRYNKIIWEQRDKENKAQIEAAERGYLKKLKDKYEKENNG